MAGVALLMALGATPAQAITFNVAASDEAGLIAAITAANDETANPGADTIELANSTFTLTAVNNTTFGATGLPVIASDITLQGNGSTISRTAGSPNFRIMAVNSSGNLTLQNTTISGGLIDATMRPLDDGGGIANYGGTVTLTGATVTGNSAASGGGGVYNDSGTMTLTNATVSGNSAANNGGVANDGTMTLSRTLISGNTGGASPEVTNFAGATINASDFNLFGANGSAGTNFTPGATDIVPGAGVMVANILAPLALNPPGTTRTHALVTGSPAIDAVTTGCPPPNTDQRGVMRPLGPLCDIGSFEAAPAAVPMADVSVTKTDAPDPVTVGSNVTYTVTVTNEGPDPATGVTLVDTLPSGVTFVSAPPLRGRAPAPPPSTVAWAILPRAAARK